MRTFFMLPLLASALWAVPANAEAGDVLIRLRSLLISPTGHSGPVLPAFPDGRVGVDTSVTPEIDFTYMATDHIGAELILATTKHHVSGKDSLGGLGRIAHAWLLPPTLTVQYHFFPEAHVRPYVGAGVNYTIFYSEGPSRSLESAGIHKVGLRDNVGYALQSGVDVDLTRRIFANLDVKYIDLDTVAYLQNGSALERTKVNINPVILGVGFGIRL